MAAPNAQLCDGTKKGVFGGGAIEDLSPGVNSTTLVTQPDLDKGRVWRVCAPGSGMYVQQGKPAELTANTGRMCYCPPYEVIILRAVLGEGVKVSATIAGDTTAFAGASSAIVGQFSVTAPGMPAINGFPDGASWITLQGAASKAFLMSTLDTNGYVNRTFDNVSGRVDLISSSASGNAAGPAMVLNYDQVLPTNNAAMGHYAYRSRDSNLVWNTPAFMEAVVTTVAAAAMNSSIFFGVMQNVATGAGNAQPNWGMLLDGASGSISFTGATTIKADVGALTFQAASTTGLVISQSSGITTSFPVKLAQTTVSNKTADYAVQAADMGTDFTNIGASATVNFTLPAGLASGNEVSFTVGAAQTLKVTAPASTTIRMGSTQSAAAGNIAANQVGVKVKLRYYASLVSWLATEITGTGGSTGAGAWTVT